MKMERTKVIELIQLYVTGCLNGEELQLIKSLMEDEENFPWIELAQYQNLIVLLPSVLPLELPDAQIKQQMVEKLNQLIYGESNEAKKTAQSQVKGEQKSKSKIDWASLSVTEPTISQTSGGNDELKHSESHEEVIQETESQKSEDLSSDETFSFINDVINEEIKIFLKEWEDPNEYWIYDLFVERDEIMRNTIQDFMEKPIGARQPWRVIPFNRLKKIWEDAARYGVVHDTKGLQEIQDRMIRNLLKLEVNTEIMGHSTHYPEDEIQDEGYTMEEFHEKLENPHNVYFEDPKTGQWRLSDYGLKPLWKYAEQLIRTQDPIKKIQYIDQMLNVVHMRGDIASYFVEGGSNALSQLSSGERDWEVHRPL